MWQVRSLTVNPAECVDPSSIDDSDVIIVPCEVSVVEVEALLAIAGVSSMSFLVSIVDAKVDYGLIMDWGVGV